MVTLWFHGIVTMREKKGGDQESQKMALIETAARLIKSDIKANVPHMTCAQTPLSSNHARQSVKFRDLPKSPETESRIDMLWELSFSFQEPTPNWWGMMKILHQGQAHPGSSSIIVWQ